MSNIIRRSVFHRTDAGNPPAPADSRTPEKNSENGLPEAVQEFLSRPLPLPQEIKADLDRTIVGQDEAKRTLATAIYKHYQVTYDQLAPGFPSTLEKSNVLLIGPTGSGKTALMRALAKKLDLALVIEDITAFSATAYAGRDIEEIIPDLISEAKGNPVKALNGIVYLDEIDKLSRRHQSANSGEATHGGLQQSLLKMIEGSEVAFHPPGAPKNDNSKMYFNTENVLFIAGGAFEGLEDIIAARLKKNCRGGIGFGASDRHSSKSLSREELLAQVTVEDLKEYGMSPEFLGRFHIITHLNPLNTETLKRILTEPENSLIKQYTTLFERSGVKLSFSEAALDHVANEALSRGTGARALRGLLDQSLEKALFEMPHHGRKFRAELIVDEKGCLEVVKTRRAKSKKRPKAAAGKDSENGLLEKAKCRARQAG